MVQFKHSVCLVELLFYEWFELSNYKAYLGQSDAYSLGDISRQLMMVFIIFIFALIFSFAQPEFRV